MKKARGMIRLGHGVRQLMDIPLEAIGDTVKICIIADSFASIENYKGVFECTKSLIRLRTAYGIVRIEGENLSLGELRSERAVINGRVKSVAFEN